MDKSKKKGTKKEREGEAAAADKDGLYSTPMKLRGKMADGGEGVVESASVEKGEECDGTVGIEYEPIVDSESGHQSEGDSSTISCDMLYVVVNKSKETVTSPKTCRNSAVCYSKYAVLTLTECAILSHTSIASTLQSRL